MPGHFTHIYTQRRVADWLGRQEIFNPDDSADDPAMRPLPGGFLGVDPKRAAEVMTAWPTFAAVGAIGPDLFFFCQDYSSGPLAAAPFQDDLLMLAMRVAYWADSDRDRNWEPLLVLLAEVNSTFAQVVRVLLKLQGLWDKFIKVWDATIGPIAATVDAVLDDLTGGLWAS